MPDCRISLFIPCLIDQFYPEIAIACYKILLALGYSVEYPLNQSCCGQPAFNTGYRIEATLVAKHFIRNFKDSELVVCPSGSCVSMIRNNYRKLNLHEHELEIAEALGERLFEFSEFLSDRLTERDFVRNFPHRVAYHDSCHSLRELGISNIPNKLLGLITDIDLIDFKIKKDQCCGFGGTFAVTFSELSSSIAMEKISDLIDNDIDYLCANDISCLMQLGGVLSRSGSSIATMHLVEIIAHAMGLNTSTL